MHDSIQSDVGPPGKTVQADRRQQGNEHAIPLVGIGPAFVQQLVGRVVFHFRHDSLFRNSIYLMVSTGIMAGSGFVFWLLSAKLYSTEAVGLATTLVSVMNLISIFSLFGVNSVFLRHLATSEDPDADIDTGLTLVGIVSLVLTTGFLVLLPVIAPELRFLREHPWQLVSFMVLMVVGSINMITDSVFIAFRQTVFVLIYDTAMSVAKMVLPVALIGHGAYGIFLSSALATGLAAVLSFVFMARNFSYIPHPRLSGAVLRRTVNFALWTYMAGLFNFLPASVLPLLISKLMGAEQAAYFYIPMMIANLLYVVPFATTQSLFAEGSVTTSELGILVRNAARNIALLMLPAIAFLMLFAGYILRIYGADYAAGGSTFLRLLSLSGILIAVNYIYGTVFKIRGHIKALIIVAVIGAVTTLGLSGILYHHGLTGIGIAWISGQLSVSAVSFAFDRLARRPAK